METGFSGEEGKDGECEALWLRSPERVIIRYLVQEEAEDCAKARERRMHVGK